MKTPKTKIDFRLQHHFICKNCTNKEVFKVIFYNNDDNVCSYCGSKETARILQARLKGEVLNCEYLIIPNPNN